MESCIHWFIALIFTCEGYAVDRGIIILRLYRWPVRAYITFYDKGLSVRMGYRCLLSDSFSGWRRLRTGYFNVCGTRTWLSWRLF